TEVKIELVPLNGERPKSEVAEQTVADHERSSVARPEPQLDGVWRFGRKPRWEQQAALTGAIQRDHRCQTVLRPRPERKDRRRGREDGVVLDLRQQRRIVQESV